MCWLLVLLECSTVEDFECKFFIRITSSQHVSWSEICGLLFYRCLWILVHTQICHCKNTCRRKSGRIRGCVCRKNGLPCSAKSDCGPEGKPCSNWKKLSSNAQAAVAQLPSSPFDRHQAAEAKSREEIRVRNAAETMFMIAWAKFINLIFPREMSTVDKFPCNWSQSCNSSIVFKPVLQW